MDIDRIKNFFILHVEKIILAIVVAASAFLVYQGLGQPNIMETVQPDKLTTDATQVRAALDEDHNSEIIEKRIPSFSIVERTDKSLEKVNPELYVLPYTWVPIDPSSQSKRTDPVLFRPKAVQVQGVITSIAMRSPKGDYRIKELDPADPVEKAVKVKKPSKRDARRAAMMSEDDGSMEEEASEYDIFGEASSPTSMAGPVGPTRKLPADKDQGFRPTSTKNFKTDATELPVPALGWFIAGTAVVPHQLMHESFEHSLKDVDGYDYLNRDRPIYRGYQLQRADVTDKPVDQVVDEDWVNRDTDRQITIDAILYWSGVASELVPEDYRDITLTMWVPPVLLDDYSRYTLHPLIPMLPKSELDQLKTSSEPEPTGEVEIDTIIFGADKRVADAKSLTAGSRAVVPAAVPYGMPTVDPVEYKMVRFYDFATDPRGDKDAPKPGRKYVYRVRVSIDDPNFPSDFTRQPPQKSLHPETYARVRPLIAEAKEKAIRQYQRWTEWSDPSDPVSLPSLDQHFVGKIESKGVRPMQVGNRTIEFEASPPTAKMVITKFSPEVQTRIPLVIDVTEGSVLSAQADFADVVDPIDLTIRKFQYLDEDGEPIPDKKVSVVSGTTVIDINGGGKLEIDSTEGMNEPGYMLIFDPNGGLSVHSEADDQTMYRTHSYADERGE